METNKYQVKPLEYTVDGAETGLVFHQTSHGYYIEEYWDEDIPTVFTLRREDWDAEYGESKFISQHPTLQEAKKALQEYHESELIRGNFFPWLEGEVSFTIVEATE